MPAEYQYIKEKAVQIFAADLAEDLLRHRGRSGPVNQGFKLKLISLCTKHLTDCWEAAATAALKDYDTVDQAQLEIFEKVI